MSNTDGTCEYVLDPDDPETWGGEEGDECYVRDEMMNEEGVWRCPHHSEEGQEYCIFHLPLTEKRDTNLIEKLIEILQLSLEPDSDVSEKHTSFIGSKFNSLKIHYSDIKNINNINFKHSEFKSEINIAESEIEPDLYFDGISVSEFNLFKSKFNGKLSFQCAKIGTLCALDCEFKDTVHFGGSEVQQKSIFTSSKFKSAKFDKIRWTGTQFRGIEFGTTVFFHPKFKKSLVIVGCSFDNFIFSGSNKELSGGVRLSEVSFQKRPYITNVHFGENSDIKDVDLSEGKITNCKFENSNLKGVNFSNADLTNTSFVCSILENTQFIRSILNGVNFKGSALHGAVFSDAVINEDTTLGKKCTYDPRFEDPRASFFDEQVESDLNKAAGTYRLFEELGRVNAFPNVISHNFILRKDIHRKQHRQEGRWGRWLQATAAKYVLEYGENPWRLVATGVLIVVIFGLLYPLVGGLQPTGDPPITVTRVIDNPLLLAQSIYYSTLTFTTLGMGDFLPIGLGRLLTTVETSLGAIIMALLVFVFGRRAAR